MSVRLGFGTENGENDVRKRAFSGLSQRTLTTSRGPTRNLHPHGLRHTHAAQLAHEGVPINVIQAQLGHTNAATTSRYLQHIAPQELITTIRRREWRGS